MAGNPTTFQGELDHGALQSEANAEEGDAPLADVLDGLDLSGDAPMAEAAGDEKTVDVLQDGRGAHPLDFLGLDLAHDHARIESDAGVRKRLVNRLVGIVVLGVFADDADRRLVSWMAQPFQHLLPVAHLQRLGFQLKLFDNQLVQVIVDQADFLALRRW